MVWKLGVSLRGPPSARSGRECPPVWRGSGGGGVELAPASLDGGSGGGAAARGGGDGGTGVRGGMAAGCGAAARWRRRRSGLGGVVVGDDPANGGENLLHRRLLRLRRLAHCRFPRTNSPRSSRRRLESGPRAANHPHHSILTRIGSSMARPVLNATQRLWIRALRGRAARRAVQRAQDLFAVRRAHARPRCRAPDGSAPSGRRSDRQRQHLRRQPARRGQQRIGRRPPGRAARSPATRGR